MTTNRLIHVKNVIDKVTHEDHAEIINRYADLQQFPATYLLLGFLAEGGGTRLAIRERAYPDVSYGPYQHTLAFYGVVGGLKAERGIEPYPNGLMVRDTPENREAFKSYFFDMEKATADMAPRLRRLLDRDDVGGDPVLAWCRWNAPNYDWNHIDQNMQAADVTLRANAIKYASRRENYRRAWAIAQQFIDQGEVVPDTATHPAGYIAGAEWPADKARIEEQIHLLVENQRRILQGDWDGARMFLDAVDPNMAGKWTNAKFPGVPTNEAPK